MGCILDGMGRFTGPAEALAVKSAEEPPSVDFFCSACGGWDCGACWPTALASSFALLFFFAFFVLSAVCSCFFFGRVAPRHLPARQPLGALAPPDDSSILEIQSRRRSHPCC